jgi:hypothetical protein
MHLYLFSCLLILTSCLLVAQGVDKSALYRASHLAAYMGQDRGMVRLALLPNTAADVAVAGNSQLSKKHSLSTQQQQQHQQQQLQCYLLPPELPTDMRLSALSKQLERIVLNSASSYGYGGRHEGTGVRWLVEKFRLCNFEEQQPQWRQQRRLPGELVLKDINTVTLNRHNQLDRDSEKLIENTNKLLQEVSTVWCALLVFVCVNSVGEM